MHHALHTAIVISLKNFLEMEFCGKIRLLLSAYYMLDLEIVGFGVIIGKT